jgi:hypothetical protein
MQECEKKHGKTDKCRDIIVLYYSSCVELRALQKAIPHAGKLVELAWWELVICSCLGRVTYTHREHSVGERGKECMGY